MYANCIVLIQKCYIYRESQKAREPSEDPAHEVMLYPNINSNAIYANGDWACVHQPLGSGATRVSLKGRVSPLLQPSLFNIVESPIWDIKKPFGTQKATPTDFTERDKRGSVSRNTGLVSQNLNFSVMGDVHVRTLARQIACRGPRWPFSRT